MKEITVSGIKAKDKIYDGNTKAELDFSAVIIDGKADGDKLNVTATGIFENKEIGNDKTVNVTNIALDGDDAENYKLAASGQQETTKASITKANTVIRAISLCW